ncbi:hypothetical protein JKP88DRAFT_269135 [Tribonema minus]|uniref:GPI-anchor transamidase n=1 Tax=Tribonema minus TaxID=303371 RepID=A0A835YSA4_9STRA|nr:hypothetical protein JKP88DRAFT_269135 [Tribonema minus]
MTRRSRKLVGLLLLPLLLNERHLQCRANQYQPKGQQQPPQQHNNWAVLVCTSRYWFNYRHIANTLAIYRTVKQLGIQDSHIILMLADDMPCNARNSYRGHLYHGEENHFQSYSDDVEVDYRGDEVTAAAFLRLLTGRVPPTDPFSKSLRTDAASNVLVYMSGHGGDGFLKFQDANEVSAQELGDALADMRASGRYGRVLMMVDTCQAGSLFSAVAAPGVVCVGSSSLGENSYAHRVDGELGLPTMDRFSTATVEFFKVPASAAANKASVAALLRSYKPRELNSVPAVHATAGSEQIMMAAASDYFGAKTHLQLTYDGYPISWTSQHKSAA